MCIAVKMQTRTDAGRLVQSKEVSRIARKVAIGYRVDKRGIRWQLAAHVRVHVQASHNQGRVGS